MNKEALYDLAIEILNLSTKDYLGRFPYDDCRWLDRSGFCNSDDFIPDLDMYLSKIFGYCSWGRKLLDWPKNKVAEVQEDIRLSFFEEYPQYLQIIPIIKEHKLLALNRELQNCEDLRLKLNIVLSELAKSS